MSIFHKSSDSSITLMYALEEGQTFFSIVQCVATNGVHGKINLSLICFP